MNIILLVVLATPLWSQIPSVKSKKLSSAGETAVENVGNATIKTQKSVIQKLDKDFDFGVKTGFNMATFRGAEVGNKNVQIGFTGGLAFNYKISNRFETEFDVFYTEKGASARYVVQYESDTTIPGLVNNERYTTTVVNNAKLRFHNLEFPLLAKCNVITGKEFTAFVAGGPSVMVNLHSEVTGNTEVYISDFDIFDLLIGPGTKIQIQDAPIEPGRLKYKGMDFGLTVGGGSVYNIGKVKFTFDLRYNVGFLDIDEGPEILRTGAFYTIFGVVF